MRRARAALLALLFLPLLGAEGGGCSPDREVAVTVVRGGTQCGGAAAGPSVRRLGSAAELAAAFAGELGASPPAADLEGAVLLLVAAGQRPSGGHAVELAAPRAPVKGGVALVEVALRAPAPGAMTAQLLTSPCLVVSLPRAGLTEVRVVDGARAPLGAVALP